MKKTNRSMTKDDMVHKENKTLHAETIFSARSERFTLTRGLAFPYEVNRKKWYNVPVYLKARF